MCMLDHQILAREKHKHLLTIYCALNFHSLITGLSQIAYSLTVDQLARSLPIAVGKAQNNKLYQRLKHDMESSWSFVAL